MSYDVILAGLGAAGSAAAFHLAGRGASVLGLDRYHPPHTLGSSHGESRVIRESAFEGPRYVPLARQAYANWRRLEAATGELLLHVTGVLFVGRAESGVVDGTLSSAREHGVTHEPLSEPELARRYPALRRLEGAIGVFEPGGGWLDPERCVAAGPWAPALLGERGAMFSVERQVQHWFTPHDPAVLVGTPIFIRQAGDTVFYALPPVGEQVKVAVHHDGEPTTPETVSRTIAPEEIAAVYSLLQEYVPAMAGVHRRAAVCLYTNSRHGHFVIDRLPEHPSVLVASACSAFGFKFASAVGEVLADLLTDRAPSLDLAPFRMSAV